MANVNSLRRKYLRWFDNYEVRAFRALSPVFKSWGRSIDFDNMSEENYQQIIDNAVDITKLNDAYKTIYTEIGGLNGKRTGGLIINDMKFFTLGEFESTWLNEVLLWLNNNGARHIVTVESSYKQYIIQIIEQGLNDGKGIVEIAADLRKLVNRRNFYRWQSIRIARTESTRAANKGANVAGRIAGIVMDKIWFSASDSRVRSLANNKHYDHREMNKVRIRESQPFMLSAKFGMDKLMYPGDDENGASAGNLINCRCSHALVAARDRNGNLIRV